MENLPEGNTPEQKQLWKRIFQSSGSQMDPITYCANHWTVLSNQKYADLQALTGRLKKENEELKEEITTYKKVNIFSGELKVKLEKQLSEKTAEVEKLKAEIVKLKEKDL